MRWAASPTWAPPFSRTPHYQPHPKGLKNRTLRGQDPRGPMCVYGFGRRVLGFGDRVSMRSSLVSNTLSLWLRLPKAGIVGMHHPSGLFLFL